MYASVTISGRELDFANFVAYSGSFSGLADILLSWTGLDLEDTAAAVP